VDRNSEAIIAESLHGAMPGTPIVGEELSPEIVTAGLVWIVDPLDGTTNFLHNFPAFAVSIAAAVDGILQAGVVLHVPLNRLSQATRDGGAWENGNRLSVSRITDPAHSLIGTGVPFKDFSRFDEYLAQLGRIHPWRDRRATARISFTRPDRCSRWSLRRLLGAAPGAVGCGCGDVTGA
jgi:myo-inositol-1(or 4)-monophosphatase